MGIRGGGRIRWSVFAEYKGFNGYPVWEINQVVVETDIKGESLTNSLYMARQGYAYRIRRTDGLSVSAAWDG